MHVIIFQLNEENGKKVKPQKLLRSAFLLCLNSYYYLLFLLFVPVVEMFFLNKNDEYLEVELGPWGQHLLLLLQGERNAIKHSLPLDYIVTEKTDPVGDAPVSTGKG